MLSFVVLIRKGSYPTVLQHTLRHALYTSSKNNATKVASNGKKSAYKNAKNKGYG